jgi:ATP-dependent RNA helicase DDX52/ROK1
MAHFAALAAGARFDKGRHRAERRLFASAADDAAAAPAPIGSGLGALDFFGGGGPPSGAGRPAAASTADVAAASNGGRQQRRMRPSPRASSAGSAGSAGSASSLSEAPAAEGVPTERELAEANALRRSLRIHVYGTGVPAPVESAEDMAERHRLPAWLRHNVLEAGYHELTRVQMQAVPLLIGGREVLACAPTGSGKTAAFLIPMLARLGAGAGTT